MVGRLIRHLFLEKTDSFYLATANAEGQPYIQHRGGPPGFLNVLDEKTLGFADFRGNRQYLTTGNLKDNPQTFIFVMDYATRRRVKIWGRAKVAEAGGDLVSRLFPHGYRAKAEQAIVFEVSAAEMAAQAAHYEGRIAALEAKLAEFGITKSKTSHSTVHRRSASRSRSGDHQTHRLDPSPRC